MFSFGKKSGDSETTDDTPIDVDALGTPKGSPRAKDGFV